MRKKYRRYGIGILILVSAFLVSSCGKTADRSDGSLAQSVTAASELSSDPEKLTGEANQESGEEAVLSTYPYYIEELDVTLEIPENLYVYRTGGIYLDWTNEINVHDFSIWVVITKEEFDEDTLAEKLRENYEEYAEKLVFIISVTSEELYPVERLCAGVFANTDLPRISGSGYYCQTIEPFSCLTNWDGQYQGYEAAGEKRGIDGYNELLDFLAEKRKVTDPWKEAVWGKTVPAMSLSFLEMGMGSFNGEGDRRRDSIVDDRFWEVYSQAVEELISSPESYNYVGDEELIDGWIAEWTDEVERKSRNEKAYQNEPLSAVYVDPEKDIYIRAFAYARCIAGREIISENPDREPAQELAGITLKDVIVLLADWEHGQRSFVVYLRGREREFGCDYDWIADLSAAREYIVSWEKQEG